jgi:preprotein translocase subunit Sss1
MSKNIEERKVYNAIMKAVGITIVAVMVVGFILSIVTQ